jgi:hypothetical protein
VVPILGPDIETPMRTSHSSSVRRYRCSNQPVADYDPRQIDYSFVRFEVFTAVTMKNVVFWDVMPCGSCKNRRFGGT